jgi:hypothetical protein
MVFDYVVGGENMHGLIHKSWGLQWKTGKVKKSMQAS